MRIPWCAPNLRQEARYPRRAEEHCPTFPRWNPVLWKSLHPDSTDYMAACSCCQPPPTTLKFTSSREKGDPNRPERLKWLIQAEPHSTSGAPCPGQPRYDHEFTLIGGLLTRYWAKLLYPLQHFSEHIPTHHHLSKLEHQPPGMTHQTPACIY